MEADVVDLRAIADIFGILVLGLAIASFCAAEFFPHSRLGHKLTSLAYRRPRSLSEFNKRGRLSFDDFAIIEKYIPRLMNVTVLSNVVDPPTRRLADAVMDNFQQGVRYTFFISRDGTPDTTLADLREWFQAIYKAAREFAPSTGKNAAIETLEFDDLFSIRRLRTNWLSVPFMFYTHGNGGDRDSLFAIKGTTPGVGISDEYELVESTEALSLLEMCTDDSSDFRDAIGRVEPAVEGTIPAFELSRPLIDNSTVIKFPKRRA